MRGLTVFPPGDFIREEIVYRGWTRAILAELMGVTKETVNAIIAGRQTITPELAEAIGQAFGTSAELWINLQRAYDSAMEAAR